MAGSLQGKKSIRSTNRKDGDRESKIRNGEYPALYPDDPELDYHNLEGVRNGSEASTAFSNMADMSQEECQKYREYLLKYCGLDTLAMVKVWQKLMEVCK